MPSFSDYVNVEVDIDVDVDEFVSECSPREIEELIEALREGGYLVSYAPPTTGGRGYEAYEFEQSMTKLVNNYHVLTKTELEILNALAKRF